MCQIAYQGYILENRMNRQFIGVTKDLDNELDMPIKAQYKGVVTELRIPPG